MELMASAEEVFSKGRNPNRKAHFTVLNPNSPNPLVYDVQEGVGGLYVYDKKAKERVDYYNATVTNANFFKELRNLVTNGKVKHIGYHQEKDSNSVIYTYYPLEESRVPFSVCVQKSDHLRREILRRDLAVVRTQERLRARQEKVRKVALAVGAVALLATTTVTLVRLGAEAGKKEQAYLDAIQQPYITEYYEGRLQEERLEQKERDQFAQLVEEARNTTSSAQPANTSSFVDEMLNSSPTNENSTPNGYTR